MFIHRIPRKNKHSTHISYLLQESYRENKKVKNRTIANLTNWPEKLRLDFEALLKGGQVIDLDDNKYFEHKQGKSYGAIKVISEICKELGIQKSLGRTKYSKLILMLIAGIILSAKKSKNYIANNWCKNQAIEEVFNLNKYFNEDDLYDCLDWLSANQLKIEKTLWKSKKQEDTPRLFLYDVTSSYVEGDKIALTEYGYNRDGKKGKKQIVIGLLTDVSGDPVSVEVFTGSTRDFKTVKSQIEKLKNHFKIKEVVFVGDRGMIKSKQIKNITDENWSYITAITKPQIEKLVKEKVLQLGLFDKELCEVEIDGIRYILRKNPLRAEEIKINLNNRIEYLRTKITQKNQYLSGSKKRSPEIGLNNMTELLKKLKLSELAELNLNKRTIEISIDENIKSERLKLAGCYVLKTNVASKDLSKEKIHERYKDLAKVEKDFKNLKTGFLEIRPLFVRNEPRVRGHVFAYMLALKITRYVEMKLQKLNMPLEYVWESLNNIQYIINIFKNKSFKSLPSELNEDCQNILQTLQIKFSSRP